MFEIILFTLVCVCALTMLLCRFMFPHLAKREPEPWYLDYARSFFPVLLLVFLLRGFVAEPFRIPSESMLPTLEVGDFILVNKFTYGLRLPITHTKILPINKPERGDVVVFRYPPDPSQNYIKRLVGLPGDVISYQNKTLFVNDEQVSSSPVEEYIPAGSTTPLSQFEQVLPTKHDKEALSVTFSTLLKSERSYGFKRYSWKVPEGHYFMMGDNRDNSADSRRWGFVPDQNIVGRAFFVWMNYDHKNGTGFNFNRIGTGIKAQSVATELND